VLLLQLEIPMETVVYAAEQAHQAGLRVILNPAPAPPGPLPAELLRCVDILTPNEGEVGALAGTLVADLASAQMASLRLIEQGAGAVIVTLGAQGALIVAPDIQQHVPGFGVQVADTTAAGDAFNGGLAVAVAEGKDLLQAVRFANACGALASTKLGAQPSLPTAAAVAGLMI